MTDHAAQTGQPEQPLVLTADHADGRIRVIRLNNHPKRNKLDIPMCDAIEEAMLAAVEDGARVVLLHGDGTVFSAGADLSGDVYSGGFYPRLLEMLGTIQTLPVPVVAWVNGPAIGAGTQLSMACDLRVVDDTALFREIGRAHV